MSERRICVGAIGGPHGVRGNVRISPFTADPEDVTAYGPITDESGARRFEIEILGRSAGQLIARIDGIEDRDAAAALKGIRLYVPRSSLPEPEEEEYYHADLIGLTAHDRDGKEVGTIRGIFDFGAGDVLEIVDAAQRSVWVPFTREAVPAIDLDMRRVTVDVPAETEDERGSED
jgi:16S rRNA processing protein RimM